MDDNFEDGFEFVSHSDTEDAEPFSILYPLALSNTQEDDNINNKNNKFHAFFCFDFCCQPSEVRTLLIETELPRHENERGLRYFWPNRGNSNDSDVGLFSQISKCRKRVFVINNSRTDCIFATKHLYFYSYQSEDDINLILPGTKSDSLPRMAKYLVLRNFNVRMETWNDQRALVKLADAIEGKIVASDVTYKPTQLGLFRGLMADPGFYWERHREPVVFWSCPQDLECCLFEALNLEDHDVKLLTATRDFQLGRMFMDNIFDALKVTSKVIHTVCDESLDSWWCTEELRLALLKESECGVGRDIIIHLVLPGTNTSKASQIVKDSMKSHPCIYMRELTDQKALLRVVCAIRGEKQGVSSRIKNFFSDTKCKIFRSRSTESRSSIIMDSGSYSDRYSDRNI